MKTIGLIVNPVAGIGGRVGLKGSDGENIQAIARERGAKAEAYRKAEMALRKLNAEAPAGSFRLLAAPKEMGAAIAANAGLDFEVVGNIFPGRTTAADTIIIARMMIKSGAELLLFAGGDGTARNICEAVGDKLPVIGIPAGVKIHSAVYAINPVNAGRAAASFCGEETVRYKEGEVMDIDETAFREGRVSARLYGYLKVPKYRDYIQSMKSGGYSEQSELAGIAAEIAEGMAADVVYIFGPGTTTRAVTERLNLPSTLLGFDAVKNGKLVGCDLSENGIYELVEGEASRLVITVIGGQGHLFGRGNQQLSPRIIRALGMAKITVIATKNKLYDLLPASLISDTGDESLDQALSGFVKVITGYRDSVIFPIRS